MSKTKTVIIILGPTASGKTVLSLELASHFRTSIVSADARQCFRELNIGVAKPPVDALNFIKHYFINSHSIHDDVNAQVFEEYALKAVSEIFIKNETAIMVGGTGLYIKAFCEGLDEIPEVEASLRNGIIDSYNRNGLAWLQDELRKKDPGFFMHAEQKNPQRLMRALEVVMATGNSIMSFRKNEKKQRDFRIIKIGLDLPKEQLHSNIEKRVDTMVTDGLVEEARALEPFRHLNALRTVGYTELFKFFDGEKTLQEAIDDIKLNTRRYAKRQLTWFKKDSSIKWFEHDSPEKKILINALLHAL